MSAPGPRDTTAPLSGGERAGDTRLCGVRILVVDDDPDARELLVTVLEQRGAEVSVATCAADAFARLVAEVPDVLVSDIGMPDEDGLSMIARVRALPPHEGGGVAAIAVTAYAARTDRVRALEAGFDRYFSKPVELSALIAAIDGLRARHLRAG